MPGNVKHHGPKVEPGRSKILLTRILQSPRFFNAACNGRPVIGWYVELFDSVWFYKF